MSYITDAKKILRLFLSNATKYEQKEMILLANKWGVVSSSLDDLINQLSEKTILSKDQLFRLDLYQKFIKESSLQVTKYNQYANGIITEGQKVFANAGIQIVQNSIELITTNFNRINVDAVNNLIGLSSQDSSLYQLLNKSYPETVDKIVNQLIDSTARGINPKETARLISDKLNFNLSRSLIITRTEQLNVMRITSIEQMQKSGVCNGWIRIEESDACDECIAENGKKYSFEDSFDTHPNCRGGCIPDVE